MKHLNYRQIRALIKKDILVRLRQPVSMPNSTHTFFLTFETFIFSLAVDDISLNFLALCNIHVTLHFKTEI